jgi:hypothetical protein
MPRGGARIFSKLASSAGGGDQHVTQSAIADRGAAKDRSVASASRGHDDVALLSAEAVQGAGRGALAAVSAIGLHEIPGCPDPLAVLAGGAPGLRALGEVCLASRLESEPEPQRSAYRTLSDRRMQIHSAEEREL